MANVIDVGSIANDWLSYISLRAMLCNAIRRIRKSLKEGIPSRANYNDLHRLKGEVIKFDALLSWAQTRRLCSR